MKYLTAAYIGALSVLFTHFSSFIYAKESSTPSHYDEWKYETSIDHTEVSSNDWWNRIEPYNIYLGGLPLKNKDHLYEIANLGTTWVISLVENFELDESELNPLLQTHEWQQYGISTEHIPVEDFKSLNLEEIKWGVESLAQALEHGHTVYILCKGNKECSTSIAIAYLMQYQMLPYDDAFALVQQQWPIINLSNQQKQAILDYFKTYANLQDELAVSWTSEIQDYLSTYFQNTNDITEGKLAQTLDSLFYYAVEGADISEIPPSIADWIPQLNIESTLSRRNRYLLEFAGNQDKATAEAIKRNHSYFRKMQLMALGVIPFVGSPASYSWNLWYQLREICLIASLHGHDLYDPEVKIKIMSALVGATAVNTAVSLVTKTIAKEILIQAGATAVPGAIITIPLKMTYNYFTDNSTKVAEHAQALFAGEHSLLIPESTSFTAQN